MSGMCIQSLQWTFSIADTLGAAENVLISEVSSFYGEFGSIRTSWDLRQCPDLYWRCPYRESFNGITNY